MLSVSISVLNYRGEYCRSVYIRAVLYGLANECTRAVPMFEKAPRRLNAAGEYLQVPREMGTRLEN